MDGHTGADDTRGDRGPVARLHALRSLRGRALLTAVALPLLPAAPLLAATWVAVSAHSVASGAAVPPVASALSDPTPAVTFFAGLTLAAFLVGLPTAVNAGLLVFGGSLLGRDVPVRAAWRRALHRAPTALALLVPTGALVGLLARGITRLASEDSWSAPTAATVVLTVPVLLALFLLALFLLVLALPTAVLADLPPWRALAEAGRIVRKRRTSHLVAPALAALPLTGHADPVGSSDAPVPAPVLACLLALAPLTAAGLLWSGPHVPQDPSTPSATRSVAAGPAGNRATVQIEEKDGTTHLFAVGPNGLSEVECAPDCPGGGLHGPDGDRSHARVGGHVVGAYWRTDPEHGSDTLYLSVCEAADSCGDDGVAAASGTSAQGSPENGPKWWEELLGSSVEVFEDGTAQVLGCADTDCPEWARSAPAGPAWAGTVPDLPRGAEDRSEVVTVEVDGPDTMRLVVLACGDTSCDGSTRRPA